MKELQFQSPLQQCANTHCNNCAAILGTISHSAHFHNMSPPDYFAFSKLKMELKGDQYKNILEIQKSVTAKLKALPIHE